MSPVERAVARKNRACQAFDNPSTWSWRLSLSLVEVGRPAWGAGGAHSVERSPSPPSEGCAHVWFHLKSLQPLHALRGKPACCPEEGLGLWNQGDPLRFMGRLLL